MRLALIAKSGHPNFHAVLRTLLHWCCRNDVPIHASTDHLEEMRQASEQEAEGSIEGVLNTVGDLSRCVVLTASDEESVERADFVITIGGDGTILRAAQLVKHLRRPILGIHSGKLGFLASILEPQIEEALDALKSGNVVLDSREMLAAEHPDGTVFEALNDFLFTRKDTISMIRMSATYDGMFINHYWGDGLIVASPTGSTAYNLSSGGPIVLPGTRVMVLTPINPHTLTTRPLVLPSDKPLEIEMVEQPGQILFSYDGFIETRTFDPLRFTIRHSGTFIDIVRLPGQNYFETLRRKLMWGADARSISEAP